MTPLNISSTSHLPLSAGNSTALVLTASLGILVLNGITKYFTKKNGHEDTERKTADLWIKSQLDNLGEEDEYVCPQDKDRTPEEEDALLRKAIEARRGKKNSQGVPQ